MNPLVKLKRLFEGTPDAASTPSRYHTRIEKDFMKYDLTALPRF